MYIAITIYIAFCAFWMVKGDKLQVLIIIAETVFPRFSQDEKRGHFLQNILCIFIIFITKWLLRGV